MIREELGDMLFQIVLQCQLSKEEGLFDIDDVAEDEEMEQPKPPNAPRKKKRRFIPPQELIDLTK